MGNRTGTPRRRWNGRAAMSRIAFPASSASFPTTWQDILKKAEGIDAVAYGHNRNYGDGSVTALSPYVSRGVISGRTILNILVQKGVDVQRITPFIQQLAWREYFQRVWQAKGDELLLDLKHSQDNAEFTDAPDAVLNAHSDVDAIDAMVERLVNTGYIHNHYRLYIASVICNVARTHWKNPARWMYYHLLDADLASNTCSWQWVSGAFASKKYRANQENINRFSRTDQRNTWLDAAYEELLLREIPPHFHSRTPQLYTTILPESRITGIDESLPTCVYTFYNLDPLWHASKPRNRVLLLEPSFFEAFPVCERTMDFVLKLSANIPGIQVFVGEWKDLSDLSGRSELVFKEHPAFRHFRGTQEEREWLFPNVSGYFPSFFSYWKRCERELKKMATA